MGPNRVQRPSCERRQLYEHPAFGRGGVDRPANDERVRAGFDSVRFRRSLGAL